MWVWGHNKKNGARGPGFLILNLILTGGKLLFAKLIVGYKTQGFISTCYVGLWGEKEVQNLESPLCPETGKSRVFVHSCNNVKTLSLEKRAIQYEINMRDCAHVPYISHLAGKKQLVTFSSLFDSTNMITQKRCKSVCFWGRFIIS